MKNIQEFIQATDKDDDYNIRPWIVCKDGFTFSVQGSRSHYCFPRERTMHYDKLEIGYPSIEEPLINEWADKDESYTNSTYGFVPVNVIDEVLIKHGGINITETLKLKKERSNK